jgi:tetratricopeptide (TPR) repeat protein
MNSPLTAVGAFPQLSEARREFEAGRYDNASAIIIQHLRRHPNEPRGMALLGQTALKTGALIQAEQFLRHAMALGVTSYDVQHDLASSLYQQERLGSALTAFGHLEKIGGDPKISARKAAILDKLGRQDEALLLREKLVAENPEELHFWVGYGHSLRALGRIADAEAAYRRATTIDAEFGEAWWGLADIKAQVLTDEDMATIERVLADAQDLLNVIPLHFALGRAFHDRKRYSEAFAHYDKANTLGREAMSYKPDDVSAEITDFVGLATPAFLSPRPAPTSGPVPIFLISMPRAGSTLLEQMLDQHDQVEALGELSYIRALVQAALEMHTRREPLLVPQLLALLSEDEKRAFGEDYLARVALHRHTDAPFFVDKMPMNWSDSLFIRQILPQAKFIEIRRDGMDCCFSNFVHYFSRAHAASYGLREIGQLYRDYVRMMEHLRVAAPGMVHHLRYEDLLADPEGELRGALDYLGLPWQPEILDFHQSDRAVRTPSAEQVRRPLNRKGVGAWRPYEEWLDPLKESLGELANG